MHQVILNQSSSIQLNSTQPFLSRFIPAHSLLAIRQNIYIMASTQFSSNSVELPSVHPLLLLRLISVLDLTALIVRSNRQLLPTVPHQSSSNLSLARPCSISILPQSIEPSHPPQPRAWQPYTRSQVGCREPQYYSRGQCS